MLPPPCKSGCLKAADSGKKQSTTGKICSKIINVLGNEIAKTSSKTKLGILKGGLKYANEICGAGGVPDLAKITEGLPETDKKRILQKSGSALFDGKADIPDKDFNVKSNQSPALTGKGGQVANLKASEPDIKKVSPVTEFSLSGTKLSGGTPAQTTTKQSPILLASASSAKSPADAAASAKAVVSADEPQTCAACNQLALETGQFSNKCKGICCAEEVKNHPSDAAAQGNCYSLCTNLATSEAGCKCCQDYNSLCTAWFKGCTPGGGCSPDDVLSGWWIFKKCVPACGGKAYNKNKKCCINKTTLGKKCGDECYNPETECCKDGKKFEKCGGECYNPKKECCKDGEKHSDKIKNLADCQIRFQKKDPSSNGCGGGALGAIAHTLAKMGVKDINDPTGAGITSFKSDCDNHDEGYDTCKDVYKSDKEYKEIWDAEFHKNMKDSCGNAEDVATKESCEWWADFYVNVVRKDTNYKFYEAAQLKKCRCCDIK